MSRLIDYPWPGWPRELSHWQGLSANSSGSRGGGTGRVSLDGKGKGKGKQQGLPARGGKPLEVLKLNFRGKFSTALQTVRRDASIRCSESDKILATAVEYEEQVRVMPLPAQDGEDSEQGDKCLIVKSPYLATCLRYATM